VFARTGSAAIRSSSGGFVRTEPSRPLPRIEARSKRNPSTCISVTHQASESRIRSLTTGWLQLNVFPVPEKFA
jgi:hypothetical protein